MVQNADYQGFKEQARKDRADADARLQITESVSSLSDEEVKQIAETMAFFRNDIKIATLEDGSKAFSDTHRLGIVTNEGVFTAVQFAGHISVNHGDYIDGQVENRKWLEKPEILNYSTGIEKLYEAAKVFNQNNMLYDLETLACEVSLPRWQEAAEKSPLVQKNKDFAVKNLGFDENTSVRALSANEVALVGADQLALMMNNKFYVVPDEKNISDSCVLKEVSVSADGQAQYKDIPLNEDTAKQVENVYDKVKSISVGFSEEYQDKLRALHGKSMEISSEKDRKETEAKRDADNFATLTEQYSHAVERNEQNDIFRVGHWGNNIAHDYAIYANFTDKNASLEDKREAIADMKERSEFIKEVTATHGSHLLKEELKNMETETVENLSGSLAFYSTKTGKITMKELSEEDRAKLKADLQKSVAEGDDFAIWRSKQHDTLYKLNDPMAQITTLYHENNHKNDLDISGGMSLNKTPKNSAKADRLTETKSNAAEYLCAAHQYTEMKKQGITTFEFDGQQKPLEYMLEMYDGLKEVVMEKGFDINDKQSVRNVVEASSQYWHEKRLAGYNKQASNCLNNGLSCFNCYPISKQLQLLKNEDKNYQIVSGEMLKNTYIGQNTVVDLRYCRDLLDTMTDSDTQQLVNGAYMVSYDELKSINNYLEQKGFKKDGDKMRYMSEYLNQLAYRDGQDRDPELTKILLSYNNSVQCADGLEYSMATDGSVVCHKDGKDYLLTHVSDGKDQAQNLARVPEQQTR